MNDTLLKTRDEKLAKWGPGPWVDEPEREEWRVDGVPCLIARGYLGALCGYAAAEPGHPWHGRGFSFEDPVPADVHGGVSYASACDEENGICHVPQPGEPDAVWWIGFDCAHYYDALPGRRDGVYRTADYVRAEVEALARQIIAARVVQP